MKIFIEFFFFKKLFLLKLETGKHSFSIYNWSAKIVNLMK